MSGEERRPSATQPIDRAEMFRQLEEAGEVERCPACHEGFVSPRIAARVRLALPAQRTDEPTRDDLPAVTLDVDDDGKL